ncbi:MAG TPA: right-handed parallel beta-helix repeat-containing protein [Candidatus Binatia bacterium]|nr:right-handed parallel beta-helix repeat-containing protein [Candidatus Binatia bacterium]
MRRAAEQLSRFGDRTSGRILLAAGLFLLSGAAGAGAATYYVDGNCPQNGNGLAVACATTSGGTGPKKTIDGGIALLTSPGDVLRIRGAHAAHDQETASFDGRYFADYYYVNGKHGSSSAPITIQPYNYSGPGTGETVYLDGTTLPSSGWSQCTSCSSGVCAGVPGTCGDVWYATDSGLASKVMGAQKADGTPTWRVASPSDLTNGHAAYEGTAPEIDSYSQETAGGIILVRWGQGANAPLAASNPKPHVFYNNNGNGFWVTNSSYITIQGFVLRCHRSASIILVDQDGPVSDITVRNNRILYNIDRSGSGSDYGIVVYAALSATIEGNEIAWTGSEGIHTEASSSGSALIIRGNWIHDMGDPGIQGSYPSGTPMGVILGEKGNLNGPGNYAGSVFEGNLLENLDGVSTFGGVAKGIILEHTPKNWIIRNNIIRNVAGSCIKADLADGDSIDNTQIYNNLLFRCGLNARGTTSAGIYINVGSGKLLRSNLIYNNTFVNNLDGAIWLDNAGSVSGNVIRNNILYDSGAKQVLTWPAAATFQNNLVYSTASGNVTSVNGRSWSCGGLTTSVDADGDGTANDNVKCADPKFSLLSGNDFHLLIGSPAIDAGTATGLPAGRTASINNTLAAAHGLPVYSDNLARAGSAWDAGAVEYGGVSAPAATITLSDPSPTAAGNVTLTLTTSVSVVVLPGPLTFLESDGTSSKTVVLTGALPGSVFTGTFVVDTAVADGPGSFSLPLNSLVDALGNRGNAISSGGQTTIDKTPPNAPQNLRTGT